MVGGAVMRVVGKIAGVVNGRFRGGFPSFPENITPAAFKAITARLITGVISSSDRQYDGAVNKALIKSGDCEVAEEVASSCDVGQPLPRVVFGGAPTLEEAEDATFELPTALDLVHPSNESSEGSGESDIGHDKLAISDSVHLEGKTCVTKASAPNQAIRAFRLVKESAAAQNAVASIVSDPNFLTAVMKNEAVMEYFQSQDTGMNGSLDESPADAEIPGYQSHKYSSLDESPADAEIPGYQSHKYSSLDESPADAEIPGYQSHKYSSLDESPADAEIPGYQSHKYSSLDESPADADIPGYQSHKYSSLDESPADADIPGYQSHKYSSLDESPADAEIPGYQSHKYSSLDESPADAEIPGYQSHKYSSLDESPADADIPGYQSHKYSSLDESPADAEIPGYQSHKYSSLEESPADADIPGYQSHKYSSLEESPADADIPGSPADAEIPGYQSHKYSNDEKESKNGFNSFFKDIKSRVEDMDIKSRVEDKLNSLSSFYQKLFAGSASADGSATVEKTMGASIMGFVLKVVINLSNLLDMGFFKLS